MFISYLCMLETKALPTSWHCASYDKSLSYYVIIVQVNFNKKVTKMVDDTINI